ncbi:MAG: ribulose-phosphate 3-epimerase [Armatimonadota bacterium]
MAASPLIQTIRDLTPTISVGMLTADLLSLGSEVSLLESTDVKLLHFDVMDGCFIPMTTIGPPVIKAVKTSMIKDVHLLIQDPLDKLDDYIDAGSDIITVHLESGSHMHRVLQVLGKKQNANDPARGLGRGIAINPGTPVNALEPFLDEVDMITLLAINPGWGGQGFIESTRRRLADVREMISRSGKDILLMVDGGVSKKNIEDVAGMDVDIIVTGSAVFDGKAPVENAAFMMDAVKAKA